VLAYTFSFGKDLVSLFVNNHVIGSGSIRDGLYYLTVVAPKDISVNSSACASSSFTGHKRALLSENSALLWHRRLGHISKKRVEGLVKSKILPSLNYSNLDSCSDCIKGKLTKQRKLTATRAAGLLDLVYTDICGPFPVKARGGQRYFITFIDDYSRYTYVYLLEHKSEALEVFKIYKLEVEKQLDREIKVVRSDRGGEYYGKMDNDGVNHGPFTSFLQEYGIVSQYTTLGSPDQNGH